MKTLIIILVVAMLVQTITYIYSHFFDINTNKANGATIDMLNGAVQNFVMEKERFQKILDSREKTISDLQNDCNELVKKFNTLAMFLPNSTQKEAMRQIVNGEDNESSIEILSEYLEQLKTIKYNDNKIC